MRAVGVSLYHEAIAQGRAFRPRALPALGGIYDFSELALLSLDSSGNISSIPSLGPGTAGSQSNSGKRPAPTREYGGLFARFVRSSSSNLDISTGVTLATSANSGIICCRPLTDWTSGAGCLYFGRSGASGRGWQVTRQSSTTVRWAPLLNTNTAQTFTSSTVPYGSWTMIAWTVDAGAGTYRLNGSAGGTFTQQVDVTNPRRIAGDDNTTAGAIFDGDISLIATYQTALPISALQRLEGYAAWVLARPDILPAVHPYRNVPPLRGA